MKLKKKNYSTTTSHHELHQQQGITIKHCKLGVSSWMSASVFSFTDLRYFFPPGHVILTLTWKCVYRVFLTLSTFFYNAQQYHFSCIYLVLLLFLYPFCNVYPATDFNSFISAISFFLLCSFIEFPSSNTRTRAWILPLYYVRSIIISLYLF